MTPLHLIAHFFKMRDPNANVIDLFDACLLLARRLRCFCTAARHGCTYLQMSCDLRHFTCLVNDESLIYDGTTSLPTQQYWTRPKKTASFLASEDGAWQCSATSVGFRNKLQPMLPCVWLLIPDLVTSPDNRQRWRRARGRPRNTWIRQVEVDSGLSDAAWDTAGDRCQSRAQRPRGFRVHDYDDDNESNAMASFLGDTWYTSMSI